MAARRVLALSSVLFLINNLSFCVFCVFLEFSLYQQNKTFLFTTCAKRLQGLSQIATHRATKTSIGKLDDSLIATSNQKLRVDALGTELIFDYCQTLAMQFTQHAVEQRRLAASKKTGNDRNGCRNTNHESPLFDA